MLSRRCEPPGTSYARNRVMTKYCHADYGCSPTDHVSFDQFLGHVWTLGMNAFCGLLDRQPSSVVPDDLALSCVDVGIFQCGVDPIERVDPFCASLAHRKRYYRGSPLS